MGFLRSRTPGAWWLAGKAGAAAGCGHPPAGAPRHRTQVASCQRLLAEAREQLRSQQDSRAGAEARWLAERDALEGAARRARQERDSALDRLNFQVI